MSESQPITPIQPNVKVSSLDGHRMISHASKPKPGESQNAPGPIQAPQAGEGAVVLRDAPIESVMGGGGAIVSAPKAAHSIARQQPHPALAAKMSYMPGRAPAHAAQAATAASESTETIVERERSSGASSGGISLTGNQLALLGQLLNDRRVALVTADAAPEAVAMLDDTAHALGLI